jgi:hypothetical protein
MSFIRFVLRVLTAASVVFGASMLLNMSDETEILAVVSATGAQAKEKCITIDGKRICLTEGDKKNNDDDGDNDDDKPKSKKTAKNCKKARCEPGLVVLDKPNKYGACCEAREGLPPPKPAEPEKCKFPGEVGTPPNCSCPTGTEFMGYKGCVKAQRVCCTGRYPDGTLTGPDCGAPEAAVRKVTSSAVRNGIAVKPDSITCAPE